jgi:hypothetical protein
MGMAGRPGIGSRLVILVAVASTLLATWLPPGRACACAATPAAGTTSVAKTGNKPATPCPCCRNRPADDHSNRSCCQTHEPADAELSTGTCGCSSPAQPDSTPPAAPPRPIDSDEAGNPIAADTTAAAAPTRPPVTTPAFEAARGRAGPPPVDLIISLLRITC